MTRISVGKSSTPILLLVVPVVAFFYLGLIFTMGLWYPHGLEQAAWNAHLLNFSVVYIFWLIAFFTYQLFDLDSLRSMTRLIIRLGGVALAMIVIAVIYFYFQPSLLITPRRFLLVHVAISGFGIVIWYWLMHTVLPRTWRSMIFVHETVSDQENLAKFVKDHEFLGLHYGGIATPELATKGALIIFPSRHEIDVTAVKSLYSFRRQGVRFIEFYDFYESLTRRVHLETLTELWFLNSIDYGSHQLFDAIKRFIDIVIGTIGSLLLAVLFPILAVAIKVSSPGTILFKQLRIGKNGIPFTLYKLRTMSGGLNNTWTENGDKRITSVGRWLRRLRLDELPQFINILQGDMSLVGPRPEQAHIVEQLKEQIPYYDERHIVKPGLTGWAQIHIYAGNLEETKLKLQYDLYYIKHRGFMFDMEIILRTIFKIITFNGR